MNPMSSKLKSIRISGFKSIKSCDLKLKNINILIGANGVGKSNLISAFSFMERILEKEMQLSVSESGITSLMYMGPKITREIEMEFRFDNNSYGFVLMPTNDGRLMFKREYYGYGSFKKNIQAPMGYYESQYEIGTGDGIEPWVKPVLDYRNWRVFHFHDTGRTSRIKMEHNVHDNERLRFDASNLAAFLLMLRESYPKNYNDILDAVKLVAPYFKDFVLSTQQNDGENIILRWKQKGCDEVFSASQMSDGTLRFICLATLFLQPPGLQPSTIVLDEPELGLHPFAIILLGEMVEKVSKRKQVIISTQSVELLNQFDPDDVIISESGPNGTVFKRLDAESLRMWLDEDYTLGDLWKKNVFGGRP